MQTKNNTTFIIVGSVVAVVAVAFIVIGPGFGGFIRNDQHAEATCEELEAVSAHYKEMTVNQGDSFSVYLCGYPATGGRWTNMFDGSHQIAEFDYTEFVVDQDTVDEWETAEVGMRRWRGKAIGIGTATFRSEYKMPGETNPAKIFELILTVE